MDTDSFSSFSSVLPDQTRQRFTLSEIQSATKNFDETLVVGRGGFGKVYKCSIGIGSAREVAVKQLHSMSNQGTHEFEAEVQILSKLRHGNLVSLLGFCSEEKDMVLVYEFMPNGTLEDHLHKPDSCLSWLQLLKICIGAARGLDYLHMGTSTQHGVIHRDVKSSNILLDGNFDAKVSDFGLAKIRLIDRTHVSTSVKGTFGYLDPCYVYTGKLTEKTDVYAFGVVLFEVLSGKNAVGDEEQWGLAGWALHQIKQGKLNQVVDPRLMGQISKKCLKEFARIAGQSLHPQPKQRPTMAEVVVKLESILSQERESTNSVVDEEGFVYKLRSLFTAKVDASITGSKSDILHEVDAAIESKSDFSSQYKLKVVTLNTAIESNTSKSYRAFTYDELTSATNGFKDKEHFPTFGKYIYKGWVNERTYEPTKYGIGLAMYARKLDIRIRKPDIKLEDFNHPNLVKFLGYCFSDHELFCVYELISGITLDKYLYGDPGRTSLSWVARLKIAIGAAEGLFYFHKWNKTAYSQFKTNLILVDTDFNARLLDFAFDSLTYEFDAYYAAPEWFRFQADIFDGLDWLRPPEDGFAMKNEIYTFGVVLLEILTGMEVYDKLRRFGKQNLVEWATPLLTDEMNLGIVIDSQLQHNNCPPKGAFKVAQLISSCLQPKQEKRPSMNKILKVLNHCYIEEIKTV